jgi:DNA repair protein RecN (Recombination protein N)
MAAFSITPSAGCSNPPTVLTSLALRDVVLIERLDLALDAGLTVLTGETGAGKSILLDGLGLALGGRAEASLVRAGAEQAVATACFAPPRGHPVAALLAEHGIEAEDELVLRRVVGQDGRSRALINDQPVGVALLRLVGSLLVEVEGQHGQQGLADPATHRAVLDEFAVPPPALAETAQSWTAWREADRRHRDAETQIAAALRDQEWLAHQVAELDELAPEPGEETALADARQALQHGERRAQAIAAAIEELSPRDRRSSGPASALRAASRALERMVPPRSEQPNPAQHVLAALERAEDAVAEADSLLNQLAHDAGDDPRQLERLEERLFALRAAARKHAVPVTELATLRAKLQARLAAIATGEAERATLAAAAATARAAYESAASRLTTHRRDAATRLDRALNRELPPLKLERARFVAEVVTQDEKSWSALGADQVRFLIATNPGQSPGPLGRVASGGELSRLMLALKVVIASNAPLPTLIFDEVDSGVGGATAAAVGERLARLAQNVQVLVVTHSPQVAARGARHLRVSKSVRGRHSATEVTLLDAAARREEIARMLAGATITDAARSAADSLLGPP